MHISIVTKMEIEHYMTHCATPVIMRLHTKLPKNSGWALLIMGSKCLRSRSQWFMLHNCFPFTPIIMSLRIKTPRELRMCSPDFGVKPSKAKVTMHWLLKTVFVHNCFPFTVNIMKLHTKTPLELRMCTIYLGVKTSKVKVTMHWLLKMV